jgi:hypothetical protein
MLRRIYKLCWTLQGPEIYTIPLVSRMHTHCRTLQLRKIKSHTLLRQVLRKTTYDFVFGLCPTFYINYFYLNWSCVGDW